ncbi:hypothetical protein JEQ12_018782, partial [Ovis aries]
MERGEARISVIHAGAVPDARTWVRDSCADQRVAVTSVQGSRAMAFKCSSNTLAASRVGGGGGGWNPAGLGQQLREKGKNWSGLWSTKLPALSTASVVEGCGTDDWLIALLARPSEIAILAREPFPTPVEWGDHPPFQ